MVFDLVGDRFAEPAVRSLAWRGRYLVVGFATGSIPSIPLNLALLKGASIGIFWVASRNVDRSGVGRTLGSCFGELRLGN